MASLDDTQNAYESEEWLAETRADIARRYAGARLHSRIVRFFRYALPIASVGGVLAFVAMAYLMPDLPVELSASSIDVSGNAIVMRDPHISGYLSGGRAYEVRADRAEQQLQNTKIVTLYNIVATIEFDNGESAKVMAKSGTFYTDKQRIVLDEKIDLTTTTGISGTLQSADIDMANGSMITDQPIDFSSKGSRILANRTQVANKGERVTFSDGVKVTYSVPDESKAKAAEPQR